jgi:hypothetical protein
MQQETTQELIDWECQESFSVLVSGVPPAECNFIILEANETMIGNRDPMRICPEIPKHLFGSAERGLAIYDPAPSEQLTEEAAKHSGLRPASEQAVEPQLSGSVSFPEALDKLAAENFVEHIFREEEAMVTGTHPVGVVAGETTGGYDAMNMRMMLQLLIPGMEDAEETDLSAEAFGI